MLDKRGTDCRANGKESPSSRDNRRDRKVKHKVPPTYARAEDCARSLYGRRDDGGLDGIGGIADIGEGKSDETYAKLG